MDDPEELVENPDDQGSDESDERLASQAEMGRCYTMGTKFRMFGGSSVAAADLPVGDRVLDSHGDAAMWCRGLPKTNTSWSI